MVINGAIVSDLDMMYLESVLQEELALCMMMRSSRTEPPDLAGIMRATDDIIESLVCPPPPSEPPVISEEMISGLIVPAPGWSECHIFIKSTIICPTAFLSTWIIFFKHYFRFIQVNERKSLQSLPSSHNISF